MSKSFPQCVKNVQIENNFQQVLVCKTCYSKINSTPSLLINSKDKSFKVR